jgi:hypothetical protein
MNECCKKHKLCHVYISSFSEGLVCTGCGKLYNKARTDQSNARNSIEKSYVEEQIRKWDER